MEPKEWRFRDKSKFGDGPWQGEPDKVQWQDEGTGLPCLAVRGPMGAWCGYVGVPEGHALHGRDYQEVDVSVHGGLTYADRCVEEDREHGICHAPQPGEPDHVWWFGFDCAHSGDLAPGMTILFPDWMSEDMTYRDLAYVREECADLAGQFREMRA